MEERAAERCRVAVAAGGRVAREEQGGEGEGRAVGAGARVAEEGLGGGVEVEKQTVAVE